MTKLWASFLIILAFLTGVSVGNTFIGGHPCNWAMNQPLPTNVIRADGTPEKLFEWCTQSKR